MLSKEDMVLEALLKVVCEVKNFAIQDVLPINAETLQYADSVINEFGWKIELSGRFDPTVDLYTIRKIN